MPIRKVCAEHPPRSRDHPEPDSVGFPPCFAHVAAQIILDNLVSAALIPAIALSNLSARATLAAPLPLPLPRLTTLETGQPRLTSTRTAPRSTHTSAAAAMTEGSQPTSCAATGET